MNFDHDFQHVSNILGWDTVTDVTTLTSLIQRMLNEGKITENDCATFLAAEIGAHLDAGNRVVCSDCEGSADALYIDADPDGNPLYPVCAKCALEGEATRIESFPCNNPTRTWIRHSK